MAFPFFESAGKAGSEREPVLSDVAIREGDVASHGDQFRAAVAFFAVRVRRGNFVLGDHAGLICVGVKLEFDGGKIVRGRSPIDLRFDGEGIGLRQEFGDDMIRRGRANALLPFDLAPVAPKATKGEQKGK